MAVHSKNGTSLARKAVKYAAAVLIAAAVGAASLPVAKAEDIWAVDRQAKQDVQNGNLAAAAAKWKILLEHFLTEGASVNAALYAKDLGRYYDSLKQYDLAIYYYNLENENWLRAGHNWGAADLQRAEAIRTTLEIYMSTEDAEILSGQGKGAGAALAKFEPAYGAYIGLYPEGDPLMGNHFDRSEQFYNKKHALYLAYAQWGKPFPARYAGNAKDAGAALQIAYEPGGGLDEVTDGSYIRQWAREAKAAGIPIFLRYASEMNGGWIPWHGDPEKYIAKFRLIHDIMEEEAPNVAMVWSPGDVPLNTMAEYYPGDGYVDWVGVSMYSEPYENGDPAKPDLGLGPVERLDEIYRLYADRKPVMISETAISHLTHRDGASWTEWSVMNLERLYAVMTKKYPRLKAITYFNRDHGDAYSHNNYLLRDNDSMMEAYIRLISSPYFLTQVETGTAPSKATGYLKAEGSALFAQKTRIYPYVKLPDVYTGKVEYLLNGKLIGTEQGNPQGLDIEAGSVPPGSWLEIRAYNKDGALAAVRSIAISPSVTVKINGALQSFQQTPVLVEGTTLAPVRAIFEALGARVEWNEATRTATGRRGGTEVSMTIGDRVVKKDGKTVVLETAPALINGHTMVPARFVGEAFGAKVEWDSRTASVLITTTP
jgi:hypothetical protein